MGLTQIRSNYIKVFKSVQEAEKQELIALTKLFKDRFEYELKQINSEYFSMIILSPVEYDIPYPYPYKDCEVYIKVFPNIKYFESLDETHKILKPKSTSGTNSCECGGINFIFDILIIDETISDKERKDIANALIEPTKGLIAELLV